MSTPEKAPQVSIDMDYLAQLSRIELSEQEKACFGAQLAQVLDYFHKIDAVDVEGVEPMAHAFPLENVWDEDIPCSGLTPKEALSNAPAQREGQLIVPRVVEA